MPSLEPNSEYKVFNEEIEFKLKEISDWVEAQLPPGWGHTLLLFSLGENSELFFMSNINRDDMLATLEKFVEMSRSADQVRKPPRLLPPGDVVQ